MSPWILIHDGRAIREFAVALQHQHSAILRARVDLNLQLKHNAREFQLVQATCACVPMCACARVTASSLSPFRMEVMARVTRKRGIFLQEDKAEGYEINKICLVYFVEPPSRGRETMNWQALCNSWQRKTLYTDGLSNVLLKRWAWLWKINK